MLNVQNMTKINLINNQVAYKNFEHKSLKCDLNGFELHVRDAISQSMMNQHYIMMMLLKQDGVDVEHLEKQLDKNIQFDEFQDRWLWNSKEK